MAACNKNELYMRSQSGVLCAAENAFPAEVVEAYNLECVRFFSAIKKYIQELQVK